MAILLLVSINPKERQCPIRVQGKRQVLVVQSLVSICRPDLVVQIQVLLLKSAPILFNVGCRVWEGRVGRLIDFCTSIL